MVRCGVLFNAKQNMFSEYLDWIIKQDKLGKVKLSFIHTNENLPLVEKSKIGSYNDVRILENY